MTQIILMFLLTTVAGLTLKTAVDVLKEQEQISLSRPAITTMVTMFANHYQIPLPVANALIKTESNYNPNAYRYEAGFYRRYILNKPAWINKPYYHEPRRISASYGLTQIMYTTALSIGYRTDQPPEGLFNPDINLALGFAYFKAMLDLSGGNVELAYMKYNGGGRATLATATSQNRENTANFMTNYLAASV